MSLDMAAVRKAFELPGLGLEVHESIAGGHTLPFAVLGNLEGIKYTRSFGGTAEVTIPLWVLVDRADDQAATRALDRYVSIGNPGSVYSAIRALKEVPGKPWRSLEVLDTGPYGTADFGQAKTLAVAFNLTITA